jgi:hypothetical protein
MVSLILTENTERIFSFFLSMSAGTADIGADNVLKLLENGK